MAGGGGGHCHRPELPDGDPYVDAGQPNRRAERDRILGREAGRGGSGGTEGRQEPYLPVCTTGYMRGAGTCTRNEQQGLSCRTA